MVNHIIKSIKPPDLEVVDKSWWMREANGRFVVKSAYETVRRRKVKQQWTDLV